MVSVNQWCRERHTILCVKSQFSDVYASLETSYNTYLNFNSVLAQSKVLGIMPGD